MRSVGYDNSEQVINYCGAWGDKEIAFREWFGEGTEALFEGINIVIPKEYDLYLSRLYGDYMQLPPLEQRVPHHYCTVIDLEKPYTKYMEKEKKQ